MKIEKTLNGTVDYVVGDMPIDMEFGNNADVKTVAVLSGVGTMEQMSAKKPHVILRNISLLPDVLFKRI